MFTVVNKICIGCKKEKLMTMFSLDKNRKDGHSYYCKVCMNIKRKKNYQINKKEQNKKTQEYYKKYPWKKTLVQIKQRCENKNVINYSIYGGRGIKCLITADQLKFLWFRDKAWKLKRPSIDRKDSNKNYTLENCQFIELKENTVKDVKKSILQYDLKGNFVKEWESLSTVEIKLGICTSNISRVLHNNLNSAGGFRWRFKCPSQ